MMISAKLPMLVKAAAGLTGLTVGTVVVSNFVREAYRSDFSGDPRKQIDTVDGGTIEQVNKPRGDFNAKVFTYAGAMVGGIGFALASTVPEGAAAGRALLRGGGGALLFALGVGSVIGGLSLLNQYSGAQYHPNV